MYDALPRLKKKQAKNASLRYWGTMGLMMVWIIGMAVVEAI